MTTSSTRVPGLAWLLGLACLFAACDLEPDPFVTTIYVPAGQSVSMQAQRVPADDVYWLFSSKPVTAIVNFTSLGIESAEFTPFVDGEYIIDRWAVAGPTGVWTDSFVVRVGDTTELTLDERP